MSFYRVGAGLGALAGLGFGIYAAHANWSPDEHQKMGNEHTRIFSELLQQIGNACLQAGSLSLMIGTAGALIDCITCCKFATQAEKEALDTAKASFRSAA